VTAEESAALHNGKIIVAGRMHITEGFNQEFPFSTPLPSGVPPTYRGRNARNTWRMKGVIAVKGRPDVTGHIMEVEINPSPCPRLADLSLSKILEKGTY
jgi:hypothetical protein